MVTRFDTHTYGNASGPNKSTFIRVIYFNTGKQNTDNLSIFFDKYIFIATEEIIQLRCLGEGVMGGVLSCLQSETSPLDGTIAYTLILER